MTGHTGFFSNNYRSFKIPETRFAATYPNSCSKGCLLKTEIVDETGTRLFIKLPRRSSRGVWGKESLNKIICCRLGAQLGLPMLPYWPCVVDFMDGDVPHFGCYSTSYVTSEELAITAIDYCESEFGAYSTSGESLRKLGYADLVDTLIVWDYLVGETDRHANNIEFILKPDGSVKPAPIFDNGMSLLSAYGAYPKAWNIAQTTNNFLTFNKNTKTFTTVQSAFKLPPLADVDWQAIKGDITDKLSIPEWDMIAEFVEHNYNTLKEQGVIA